MSERSIHCAGCRVDLRERLSQVELPECRHLFCESCYNKGYNQSTGCFTCPLDWTSSSNPSQHFPAFQNSSSHWKQAQSLQDSVHYYQEMLSCLNFTLYPCLYGPNHPGFSSCPFDHSLGCAPKSAFMEQGYCGNCKAFTRKGRCPRCEADTTPRPRPQRTKVPYQKLYLPELSRLKAKNSQFSL